MGGKNYKEIIEKVIKSQHNFSALNNDKRENEKFAKDYMFFDNNSNKDCDYIGKDNIMLTNSGNKMLFSKKEEDKKIIYNLRDEYMINKDMYNDERICLSVSGGSTRGIVALKLLKKINNLFLWSI